MAPAPVEPVKSTGKFYYPGGGTYEGDWILQPPLPPVPGAPPPADPAAADKPKRLRDGKGHYIDGNYSYEGEWKNDLMHGPGSFKYASGASYEGTWENGKYHGNGTFKWPDGRSYAGEWRENRMHGIGSYVDNEGHTWTGQFFNGAGPGLNCELT
ncbi:hypothetical protein SELMODRAFT_89459 [Selaginella moellendorffii]|uniref:Uncharacterized protein n=1 Tax=Selaginella moellendorffii TaxID=88036 RepID=D8RB44_SELML|nr:hypothetical protein SELMODRAFT_93300 [Selaginella moellendorffii]EFJ30736.1 hypothetical protein SELMODRAFT_89459 [Selaginella moellendorffii]